MGTKRFKTRKRYRLTFVNENTFNAVWSVKLSRLKVWVLSGVCCAAIAALAVGLFVWSPLKNFLPGYIKPAERRQIVDNTLRVDSMLVRTAMQQRYVENIIALLDEADSLRVADAPRVDAPAEITDTLMSATENERAFVESWMERERGNLSVLTPIVAEGMMFRIPTSGAAILADGSGLQASRGATVSAINDGAVIDSHVDPITGRHTIIIQHSNDFISSYGGLAAPFVTPGQRVRSGQAIGALGADGLLPLSIWHHGTKVPLSRLIGAN